MPLDLQLFAKLPVQCTQGCLLRGYVKEGEQVGHDGGEDWVQRQDLPRHLLPYPLRVVAALKLEVAAKEIDDRQVGRGLAVGNRSGLKDQPAADTMGVGELPEQT